MTATLLQLAGLFALLSLLSVGGGNGVIPDMQRAAVSGHHWMSDQTFLDLFAISRASPGPGSLIVVLIGQQAAGLAGAAVAGLAMYVPSCLVVHVATRIWSRAAEATWRQTAESALAPVAVGLTYASGVALARSTENDLVSYAITAAATVILSLADVNPLFLLAAGGAVAIAGRQFQ
jgi:chromate transporter